MLPLAWMQGVGVELLEVKGGAQEQPHLQLESGSDWRPGCCAAAPCLQQEAQGAPQGSWWVPEWGAASMQILALCQWGCPLPHWWCENAPGQRLTTTACC